MIIQVILFVMAVLTFASGLATFFGSQSRHRMAAFWFLIATFSAAVWSVSIAVFINLGEDATAVAPVVTAFIYSSAITLVLGLTGYNSWHYKIGRIATILATVVGTFIVACIITRPDFLYTGITLSNDAQINTVHLRALDPFYIIYALYMVLTTTVAISCNMTTIMQEKKKGRRVTGDIAFFVGFSVTMLTTFFIDLIMPAWDYSLIWLGPICTAAANLGFFYRLIKQHVTTINTNWLMIFAYTIISAVASIVYLVLFYLIFTALFHGQEPSPQVIILNFIMFAIIILSVPIYREAWSAIVSTIDLNKFDMPFITRKLAQVAAKHDNYHDLADLLTTHLHFQYIGLLIDGKLYNPSAASIELTKAEISAISNIPLSRELMQHPNESTQMILNQHDIVSIASLGTKRQILIGKPLVKHSFSKKEITQMETIFNLVAAIL